MKIKLLKVKSNINLFAALYYFILIPFLHPRGFDEYFPMYKAFFTAWLYLSMIIIAFIFFADYFKDSKQSEKCLIFMLLYYVSAIIITLYTQHGLESGLQKMFATPMLGLFCGYCLKHNSHVFFNCLCNLVLLILGLTVLIFNPIFFGQFFRNEIHLMFIGHVQIGVQYGMLGILIAYLISCQKGWTFRLKLLILFSVSTMLLSQTMSSILSLVILCVGLIYQKFSHSKKLLLLKSNTYFLLYLALNWGMWIFLKLNNWLLPFSFLSLNGRNFIWKQGMLLFEKKPLLGYGVHGALIKVFWSRWVKGGEAGINYAHSQMLQVMLDGGIFLLLCFLVMLKFYIKPIEKAPCKIRMFSNICLTVILIVMTVESTFEYHYIIIIISLLSYSSAICKEKNIVEFRR